MSEDTSLLDEIAEALSHVPTPYTTEYKRLLIRAGTKSIFPLVKSLVAFCDGKRFFAEMQARQAKFIENVDREVLRNVIAITYIKVTVPDKLKEINEIISRLGSYSVPELLSLLSYNNPKIRLATALIISAEALFTPEQWDLLDVMIMGLGDYGYEPAIVLYILAISAIKRGRPNWKPLINKVMAEKGTTFEELSEELIARAIVQLSDLQDLADVQPQ